MKKAIFIPSLTGGGAERDMVNLFDALNFDYIIVLRTIEEGEIIV